MSFLRIAVPGQPVRLIDQGQATGRRSFTRYGVRGGAPGGEMVTGRKAMPLPVPATTQARRDQIAAYRAARAK